MRIISAIRRRVSHILDNPVLLKHRSVGTKIAILNGIAIVFMAVAMYLHYTDLTESGQRWDNTYENEIIPLTDISSVQLNLKKTDALLLEFLLANDSAKQAEVAVEIKKLTAANDELLKQYEAKADSGEKALLDSFNTEYQNQRKLMSDAVAGGASVQQAYQLYESQVKPMQTKLEEISGKLQQLHRNQTEEHSRENQEVIDRKVSTLIWLSVGVYILLAFAGYSIHRVIKRPIVQIQKLMARVEQGDLTVSGQYQSKDEIGKLTKSFNGMVVGLRSMMILVQESSLTLSASAQEFIASAEESKSAGDLIARSTQELASGLDQQVKSVGLAAGVSSSMKDSIGQIVAQSEKAASRTSRAAANSAAGEEEMRSTRNAIIEVHKASVASAEQMKQLEQRSQEISSIVQAISDIATRTNLLSLNASIEAARAGDAGKGFGVVAGEVKKLAEQCREQARHIGELVSATQQDIRQAADINLRNTEVMKQIADNRAVDDAFVSISRAVAKVNGNMEEIVQTVNLLAQGSDQVIAAMGEVTDVARNGAAMSQESAAANEEQLATLEDMSHNATSLAKLAEELQAGLSRFKL
jgi:methyl-accepting chemotaxis protein